MTVVDGTAASPGVAVGAALVLQTGPLVVPNVADPTAALTGAVGDVAADLRALQTRARELGRDEAAEVLGAQALMVEDEMLFDSVVEALDEGSSLNDAIVSASGAIATMFEGLDDPYIAARGADVREVAEALRRKLAGVPSVDLSLLDRPTVIIAADLTAAQTSQLDPTTVLGFAVEAGGATGHVAIIARSLGLPAVVGASGLVAACAGATEIAIDGGLGVVIVDPNAAQRAEFARRADQAAEAAALAARFRGSKVRFGDRSMTIAANVGNSADIERALDVAADGIGLFRTEFLFLDRAAPPTEEEQYRAYLEAASSFTDPVVIRTFDIGGDKPATYLDIDHEENPFLGVRGARLYGLTDDLFRSQIRAALRAAVVGDVWLMIPMISTVADMVDTRRVIDEVAAQCRADGIDIGQCKVGAMIEVPSAALIADALAPHCDFFSIGTNDLTQYTLASDRTNGSLDRYHDPLHPSVVRLCQMTVEAGHRAGISVSVCGLAAADPAAAVVYAGMGMDKLSVGPRSVNAIKSTLHGLDVEATRGLAVAACAAADAASVRALVATVIG